MFRLQAFQTVQHNQQLFHKARPFRHQRFLAVRRRHRHQQFLEAALRDRQLLRNNLSENMVLKMNSPQFCGLFCYAAIQVGMRIIFSLKPNITHMPNIKNQDPSGKVQAGVTLTVTDASSEDEAILAVENYLRMHKSEGIEMSLPEAGEDGNYNIRLT
jgi:hypothetical protein